MSLRPSPSRPPAGPQLLLTAHCSRCACLPAAPLRRAAGGPAVYARRKFEPGAPEPAEVPAKVEFCVYEQVAAHRPGLNVQRSQVKADCFTPPTASWGQLRFMPLEELERPDRGYLRGDRLVAGLEVRVAAAAAAPAGAAEGGAG